MTPCTPDFNHINNIKQSVQAVQGICITPCTRFYHKNHSTIASVQAVQGVRTPYNVRACACARPRARTHRQYHICPAHPAHITYLHDPEKEMLCRGSDKCPAQALHALHSSDFDG